MLFQAQSIKEYSARGKTNEIPSRRKNNGMCIVTAFRSAPIQCAVRNSSSTCKVEDVCARLQITSQPLYAFVDWC